MTRRLRLLVGLALPIVLLAGCAGIAGRFGDGLSAGIRQHDDPATVATALPAYLLLLDGLLVDRPQSEALLRAAAELYAAYAGSFVSEPERAQRLSARAFDYARRLHCLRLESLCRTLDGPVDTFVAAVQSVPARHLKDLHVLAAAWTGYIQSHSADWKAIAALPKAQALIEREVALDPNHAQGMPWVYLGVLHSLRPAAVGGQPERARDAFERAISLSSGRNLMAKTLFAEFYARAQFDRELHDRLLSEVLSAQTAGDGFTLSNVLAQQRARQLQESANEYF